MSKIKTFLDKYDLLFRILSFGAWIAIIYLLFSYVGDTIMSMPNEEFLLIGFLLLSVIQSGKDFMSIIFYFTDKRKNKKQTNGINS